MSDLKKNENHFKENIKAITYGMPPPPPTPPTVTPPPLNPVIRSFRNENNMFSIGLIGC